ncbi:hypothetical protein TL16_g01964 [Triparma laevis f. inornata]|uniref:Uncharacterized protein n=2 Tax=Triparma laevis TaxID=1534972 RepID=A0A9W7KXV1_9STRA|nr:hypothetical protein TL16_g01964 [Triparma laevis f. inornata]GMI15215.1 hypothetical protein TrLO_g9849 [Triparma laevis f. longispina]
MMIPDSFQTLGLYVIHKCSELVPSNIDVSDADNDTTSEVVECLRARMNLYLTLNPNNLNPQLFVVETEDKIADAEKENAEEGFGKEKQLSELWAAMESLKLQLAPTTTNSNI